MPRISRPSSNGAVVPYTPTNAILAEALRLHEVGWWVVPAAGKKPVATEWNRTRLSATDLQDHLSHAERNIGIVLNQSKCIDVECDTQEAEQELVALFGGRMPMTPTWQSNRGKHRLFLRPAECPDKAKVMLGKVEVRGCSQTAGAFSVVPPSVHPDTGARYDWLRGLSIWEVEPADLPPMLSERLRSLKHGRGQATDDDDDGGNIPEGKRSNWLYEAGCKLWATGIMNPEGIEQALKFLNKARCKPPMTEAEVEGIAGSVCNRPPKPTQKNAEVLLAIARANSELWHTPDGVAYASIRREGHREHWRIKSTGYREWLAHQFYLEKKNAPGSATMTDVINVLQGEAKFSGPAFPAHIRVAEDGGKIYLDLCDDAWRAVEIDAKGWRIVDEPPVRFRRAKGMLALPVPVNGGAVADLRPFVNVEDKQWALLVGWMVGALRPTGPYAILKLLGEQGSAKTTTAEIARKNIDPNSAPSRRPPHSERDLMIAAGNGWVICFDNLSYVNPEMSDSLCCLARGSGFATRTLYTDDDETIIAAARPIVLNGIEDMATRSDLLDRCVILELPRIDPACRRDEEAFWSEFAEAQPKIFGALLTAASTALKNLPATKKLKTTWPRMADFAQWVVAAEPALGLKPGTFLQEYNANRQEANQTALESSPVVAALLRLLKQPESNPFEGTATELLNRLITGNDTRQKSWPKNPRALSGILIRLSPNLRAMGLTIEQERRVWRIEKPEDPNQGAHAKPQSTQKSKPKLWRWGGGGGSKPKQPV